MEELKPCPACGGDGVFRAYEESGVYTAHVICAECTMCGPAVYTNTAFEPLKPEQSVTLYIMVRDKWNALPRKE